MPRSLALLPLLVAAALACGGQPEPAAPTVPTVPTAPADGPAAVSSLSGPVSGLPTATPASVDPRGIVSDPPLGTDAAEFVQKELSDSTGSQPQINEMSGETEGTQYLLSADRAIRGVPCHSADGVLVASDGTWSCTLASPWSSGGVSVAAGSHAVFWLANNHAQYVAIAEGGPPLVLGGVPCMTFAQLDVDGNLRSCRVGSAEHVFQGTLTLPVGTMLDLDGAGHATKAMLLDPATVNGTAYGADFELTFDADGKVTSAEMMVGD